MMGLLCLCDLDPFCVCVDGGWSCPGHMHHATAEPGTRDPAVGMSTGGTVGLPGTDWGGNFSYIGRRQAISFHIST